jgi:hypothetical protein
LALLIGTRLASALDYAHRKRDFDDHELGLVHRDVSPQNVLLSYDGDIKLCDFGIVKAVSRAQHTKMGALKGKLQYMSPEQAWGRKVDPRSDLFSLGSILFEMLVGQRLFPGDNELSVLEAVRECEVPAPRDVESSVPEAVDQLVQKSLQKEPDARFQDAGEMLQEMESILYGLDPTPSQADLAAFMHEVLTGSETTKPSRPRESATPPAAATDRTEGEDGSEAPSPDSHLVEASDLAQEMRETQHLGEATPPSSAPQGGSENQEVLEVGRVVEVVQPKEAVDPQLGGSALGKHWRWLVWLAIAIAAILAWTQLRGRSEPPAKPLSRSQPAKPTPAELAADGAVGTAAPGEATQEAGASEDSGATATPAPSTLERQEIEERVDQELSRRQAAMEAEFKAEEQRLLSALREIEQEGTESSEPPSESAGAEPPVQDSVFRPEPMSRTRLVHHLEGGYSASAPGEPNSLRPDSGIFALFD